MIYALSRPVFRGAIFFLTTAGYSGIIFLIIIRKVSDHMKEKVLLFDLDGTLLTGEKTISPRTLDELRRCREKGYIIGVATSRSTGNSTRFTEALSPELVISDGGAMVRENGRVIICEAFSGEETSGIIACVREVCGNVSITVDTREGEHLRNYVPEQDALEASWGQSSFNDFSDFAESSLKICAEVFDEADAAKMAEALPQCDCIRFTDGFWYKLTRAGVNKESAVIRLCEHMGITPADIAAFGDDLADIGMLRLCGRGIAMGNSCDEVKQIADEVIGSNDEDGIADFLHKYV